MVQFVPVNPGGQSQLYPFTLSVQAPPLLQGLPAQSSISGIYKVMM